MIRKIQPKDITRIADIWLESSIIAHDFISAEFWRSNYDVMVNELLPKSHGYVFVIDAETVGFVVDTEGFIDAFFVDPKNQGIGIGASLMRHIQQEHSKISLCVYKDNELAKRFYQSHGFVVTGENTCSHTGCPEFKMEWKKGNVRKQAQQVVAPDS
ncbi:GNAT family N-acetyltransferase [Verrucomicrobiaceae bacterium N1E253]|uniref:GNAT family N-acetyltransferase n=1 Tax=Oceaniferula marina TaxID=2748318 RepID=A0A851GU07_9BACT|nr:GNAT family N-acetyltransferase [Oceaniferula marina]NWK57814.1 GNAT family N-acetyltransferase [Oceaniferula marina]